jgi:hypothetical protein
MFTFVVQRRDQILLNSKFCHWYSSLPFPFPHGHVSPPLLPSTMSPPPSGKGKESGTARVLGSGASGTWQQKYFSWGKSLMDASVFKASRSC